MENNEEIKHFIKLFFNFAKEKLNISSCPRVILVYDDQNAKDFFGKTGSYDPKTQTIHVYVKDRHPKDITRSFAHELFHHKQNLDGKMDNNAQYEDRRTLFSKR